ncbi:MAG: thioredoxin family protein [Ramlibacter sp.]|nr:thioredoxin family protein [Ramlibacter sp.]
MNSASTETEPSRADVEMLRGPVVLEFGTSWCGWCRGAQPLIGAAVAAHPSVRHVKIEDGPGRPLGRSFRVKLWPTLVFLLDGKEIGRVVRPQDAEDLRRALLQIDPRGG